MAIILNTKSWFQGGFPLWKIWLHGKRYWKSLSRNLLLSLSYAIWYSFTTRCNSRRIITYHTQSEQCLIAVILHYVVHSGPSVLRQEKLALLQNYRSHVTRPRVERSDLVCTRSVSSALLQNVERSGIARSAPAMRQLEGSLDETIPLYKITMVLHSGFFDSEVEYLRYVSAITAW